MISLISVAFAALLWHPETAVPSRQSLAAAETLTAAATVSPIPSATNHAEAPLPYSPAPGSAAPRGSGNGTGVACTEECYELYEPVNFHFIGYACVEGTEGDRCTATTKTCSIHITGCGDPVDPNGAEEEYLVSSDAGLLLTSVTYCHRGNTIVREQRIGFAHARQWDALLFRDRDDGARVLTGPAD